MLTSGKDRYYLHSSYRWVDELRRQRPLPIVALNSRTAREYGLAEGDQATVETRFGRMTQTVHVTEKVAPGIVYAASGWWFPEGNPAEQFGWEQANYNLLTSTDTLGKEFGTPNLKGIGCRIHKPRPG